MTDSYRSPDVRALGDEDLAEAGFPAPRREAFRVAFDPDAHAGIARHVRDDTSVEVGGVLVGQWHRDADGPFVRVSQFIVCDSSKNRAAEMTFTHEAWTKINHEMDTRFGDLRIVGWYHSHPSFGIFLSDRDRFIQENFFSSPGQIAYVVDPVRNTEGVFVWRDGKPTLAEHYWVGERIVAGADHAADEKPPATAPADAPPPPAERPAARGGMLVTVSLYLLAFLLGYVLAPGFSRVDQRRLAEGAVAHYGIWKGLRPGLDEALLDVDAELAKASAAIDSLAAENNGPANEGDDAADAAKGDGEKPADPRAQRERAKDHLATASRRLDEIRERYCLTPEEKAVVAQIILSKTSQLNAASQSADKRADDGASRKTSADDAAAEPTENTRPAAKE